MPLAGASFSGVAAAAVDPFELLEIPRRNAATLVNLGGTKLRTKLEDIIAGRHER